MTIRYHIFAVSLGVLLAGTVQAEELNPVVGKAGDYVLREADLDRLLANQPPEALKAVLESPEQRANFIRQVLLTKATAAKARKEAFDRKPEVKEILGNLLDQFLAQEYLTKVVIGDATPGDDELKQYYAEHLKDFEVPEAVKVRHIFISLTKDSTAEQKDKARSKADGILQQVKKGGDFEKIAREQSEDDDSAPKGGDLGFISPGKTNSKEFEDAVFALKAGEVGNLVETPFGFHVVKVDEKKEKRIATFEETRDYLRNQLKEQGKQKRAREFLEKLTKESGLEVVGEKKEPEKKP